MCCTQFLLGLMLLGFMGTAAALGTGDFGHPGGQTSISVNPRSFVTTIDTEYLLDMLPAPAVAAFSPDISQIAGREAVAYKRDPDDASAGGGHFSQGDYTVPIFGNLTAVFNHANLKPGSLVSTLGAVYGGVLRAIEPPEPRGWMALAAGIGMIGMMVGRISRMT